MPELLGAKGRFWTDGNGRRHMVMVAEYRGCVVIIRDGVGWIFTAR